MKLSSLVLVVFLFSCNNSSSPPPPQIDMTKMQVGVVDHKDMYMYTIDSCEYIGSIRGFNDDVIAHKGNCKYCAARNNKPCN